MSNSTTTLNFFKRKNLNNSEVIADDFLMDSMILYIEKEIAAQFGIKSIIDDFRDLKECRVPF